MKAVQKQLGILTLLLSCAAAQDTASQRVTIQNIAVVRDRGDLRVEVTLSSPVRPSIELAHHPDRLLVQLPNTKDRSRQGKIEVNSNGVRTVHTVLALEDGTSTNIVVELDHARPYVWSSDRNRIVLTFSSVASAQERSARDTTTAASSAGLSEAGQHQATLQSTGSSKSAPSIIPAASPAVSSGVHPIQLPSTSPSSAAEVSRTAQVAPVPQSPPTAPGPHGSAGQPALPTPSQPPAQTLQAASEASAKASPAGAPPQAPTSGGIKPVLTVRAADPALRTVFRVKYVAEGVAYLDGGRSSGLKEGVKLDVQDTDLPAHQGASVDPTDPRIVAELEVTAVAETSAVTDVHSPMRPLKAGDLAYLSSTDAEALVQQTALSATRKYPAVVTFTEGDPLDEEVIAEVPRPPMPSVNRFRGRIGFDYMGTINHGSSAMTSSDIGMIFRGDITRIGGTYWNLSGYWRGRFTSQTPASQQTLQDLINRTYHLSMTYDSPNSGWVAGFGRLYLPWAASLDTIDGGYFGRKLAGGATLGIFGGSTPDPTSWDYSPDRVIGGSFINFEGGDYTKIHYSSTMGGGISMLKWQLDKPFGFLENSLSFSQRVSIYDALQVDSPSGNPEVVAPGPGLSRNFLTLRVQPHPRVELDFNHTYFRDIPTFDPQLIGTGLLDKYLFQGFSAGGRVEVWRKIFLYTQLGRSSRTGDAKSSLNQMYGITFGRLPWFGLRADFHYARFVSSFGDGSYKAFSISRNFTDNLRLEVLAGEQAFSSAMTSNSRYRFITSNVETNLGSRYFIQGGYTANRGQLSYDQWMITLGLRFDSKARHRE